ncbi:MAG: aspartate aminotransferase [Thiotrichales bacterium SG8_50]|nr:MAG: aspartate aminotransferase [Thiotrichales bacterium SG8_50]
MALNIDALALAGVRGLRPYEPGKPLEELEREYGIRDAIKLASNENPLGPSPVALGAIETRLADLSRYPDGNGFSLKKALSEKFGLEPDQITLGNGSNDVLEFIARAFVAPDNEVVFSRHSFAVYPIVTQAVGATAVVVPAKNWGCDLQAMASHITDRTRVVFIANPNNPTGTWHTGDELKLFIAALPAHVLCVIDEAYYEYVESKDYPNAMSWLPEFDNLIVTRTFSKIYGLAGLRIGYGASSRAIADMLNRVRQPFNTNSLALAAAEAALGDDTHLQASRAINNAGMKQLVSAFEELGLDYIPSVGNFIAVDVGRKGVDVYEQLLREGVIVRPVANYEMPNHLRITIGTEIENRKFIEALTSVLNR